MHRWVRRAHSFASFLAVVGSLLAAITTLPAEATCDPGGHPDAGDISVIHLTRYCFPGSCEPQFDLNIARSTRYVNARASGTTTFVRLKALGVAPVPRGDYALDGDPDALLRELALELTASDVLSIHFSPGLMHLDGPEHLITIDRCAVVTTIATVPEPVEWLTYSDANGRRFFNLMDRLGSIVSRQRWVPVPPTPAPSPSP